MSQLATSSVHRDNSSMLIWVLLLILGGVLVACCHQCLIRTPPWQS